MSRPNEVRSLGTVGNRIPNPCRPEANPYVLKAQETAGLTERGAGEWHAPGISLYAVCSYAGLGEQWPSQGV